MFDARKEAERAIGEHDCDYLDFLSKGIEMPGLTTRISAALLQAFNAGVDAAAELVEEELIEYASICHNTMMMLRFRDKVRAALAEFKRQGESK
jgi:hypothetical protein